ncbi:histone deacetylase complex subunit SAP25 isoform X2 [Pseudophryne corroboree]|uniref:histone deacetylase complex subunit SAP25 isoform X2 n=1 Tax=Pseudophryne corroboree TaxID=495146 RepID=UPI0030816596
MYWGNRNIMCIYIYSNSLYCGGSSVAGVLYKWGQMLCSDQTDCNSGEETDDGDFSDDGSARSADDDETEDQCSPSALPSIPSEENVPSARTLYHPTFEAYYAAVAILQTSETPEMQKRRQDGFSVNNGEYFYTDPLLPAGHRVYNCLSPATQNVFGCFRLQTPAPIMSSCIYYSSVASEPPSPGGGGDPITLLCISQEAGTPVLNTATGLPDLVYDGGRIDVTTSDPVSLACEIVGIIPPQSAHIVAEERSPPQSAHKAEERMSPHGSGCSAEVSPPHPYSNNVYSLSELEAVSALLGLSGSCALCDAQ